MERSHSCAGRVSHFISIREPRLVGSGKMRGQRQCPARRAFVVQSLCDRWRGGGGGGAKECVVSEDLRRQVGFGVDTAKSGAVRVGPEARRLATRARAPLGRRKLRLLAAGTVGCHRFACVQDRRARQYASAVIDHHNKSTIVVAFSPSNRAAYMLRVHCKDRSFTTAPRDVSSRFCLHADSTR